MCQSFIYFVLLLNHYHLRFPNSTYTRASSDIYRCCKSLAKKKTEPFLVLVDTISDGNNACIYQLLQIVLSQNCVNDMYKRSDVLFLLLLEAMYNI